MRSRVPRDRDASRHDATDIATMDFDGQRRITSVGRFVTEKFAVTGAGGHERNFTSLPADLRARLDEADAAEADATSASLPP